MGEELLEAYVVSSQEQAVALLNPLRAELLARMTKPISAAELAREMGDGAQRINYHLKALEKVGLVRRVGTRQVKNLVEVLYQAVAKSFILADTLGMKPEAAERLRDQGALSHLIAASDKLKQDAIRLLEGAEQGEPSPSFSTRLQIRLKGEEQRARFVKEYMALLEHLVNQYDQAEDEELQEDGEQQQVRGDTSSQPESFEVMLAVYPTPPQPKGD